MRAPDAAASEDFPACRFLASDSVPPGYHAWPAVEFDADKLSENKAAIAYLYGQLKNRHEEDILLRADDIACTYSGKRWTDNAWMMAMLVALGSPNAFLLPSTFSEPVTGTLVLSFDATLSPEDPNFPAWRESAGGLMIQARLAKLEGRLTDALFFYEKAARQGDAGAQFTCGEMYYNGERAAKDKALYWYEKAAEGGDPVAQYECGRMYCHGEGAARDMTKARLYYQKAAAQTEDEEAQEAAKNALQKYF